jgi:hypothetical protein
MVEKYLYVKWNGVKRQAVAKTPKVDHSGTQQQGWNVGEVKARSCFLWHLNLYTLHCSFSSAPTTMHWKMK